MNFSRRQQTLVTALLLVCAITAEMALAQTTPPPRKVMWLHGRGEHGQGYWQRFAQDILKGRNVENDALLRFDYSSQDGYFSGNSISATATTLYQFRIATSASLSLTNRANNPIFIGHSQGGIIARELDRRIAGGLLSNAAPLGGIITVGSPNYGVGLLKARSRTTIVNGIVKDEIGLALDNALPKLILPVAYDPIWGVSALSTLGGEFLVKEICNRSGQDNFGTDVAAFITSVFAGGIGYLAGSLKRVMDISINVLSFRAGWGNVQVPTEELLLWWMPGLIASSYSGMSQSFLGASTPTEPLGISVEQMAPAGIASLGNSLIPSLTSYTSSTPRAGIYGTARFVSPIRLFSNQIGRFSNTNTTPLDIGLCQIESGAPVFPTFANNIPEKQPLNEPDDTRLLRYYNRTRDVYAGGYITNLGTGILTLPIQGLIELFDFSETAFTTAERWAQGRDFLDTEFQNTFAYLNGATRVVTTTRRTTKVGYRCPGSRALLDVPDGPDCVMEITEVDEPYSYIVSTGDDGFIAENDQKIPLRTGAGVNPLFENNFRAGIRSSCNHFTEGNHPEVHQQLRQLLVEDRTSPFYIP